jgi:hypothetical protein
MLFLKLISFYVLVYERLLDHKYLFQFDLEFRRRDIFGYLFLQSPKYYPLPSTVEIIISLGL